jgi:hypothetical protein
VTDSFDPPRAPLWQERFASPFSVLVRHGLGRILHGGERSNSGDVDLGFGVVLGMLALPGVLASLFLMDKYGSLFQVLRGELNFDPYAASLPDEYFFIVLSMVVSASVAVWKWDSLFPDRRDYNNLAPLPIGRRSFLLANLCALAILTVILSIDVNAASTLLFPAVVANSRSSFSFYVRFLAAHFVCVCVASVFGFLFVLCVLGVLIWILRPRIFHRFSTYSRFAIVVALLALIATAFAVSPLINPPGLAAHAWLRWLPPVWFVALSQIMLGRSNPAFISLVNTGWIAAALALCVALATYILSYRRLFRRGDESVGEPSDERSFVARTIFAAADRVVLRTPFERAGFRFVFRTLSRGSDQSLALGWFVGLGVVVASQSIFSAAHARPAWPPGTPSASALAIPLVLAYFLVLGLRSAFEIPINLRANWIFRITLDPQANECVPLARKVMLAVLVPPLVLIGLPLYAHFCGWRVALVHVTVIAIASALLIEISLLRFRKVPFTCSLPPFKNTSLVAILVYALGFFAFSDLLSTIEHWAFIEPMYWLLVALLFGAVAFAVRELRRGQTYIDRQPIFEDRPSAAVESINLSYGP